VISAIVLAAGRASRMGRTKQLLPVGDRPMLQHAIDASAEAGVDEIVVVLGHDAERVLAGIRLPPNGRIAVNPAFAEGQSGSVRAGLAATAPDSLAAVILLADQPGMPAAAVSAVVDEFRRTGAKVVRASFGGVPGHPVLLARETWDAVAAVEGDVGARELVAAHPEWVREVDLPGVAPPDVDTPEDYTRLIDGPS
jgi:molybdenum cofactor cytidylyltransferase